MPNEQDNSQEEKMKDKYFQRMGIPEESACYVKWRRLWNSKKGCDIC
jgi:hypothetical protein